MEMGRMALIVKDIAIPSILHSTKYVIRYRSWVNLLGVSFYS